MANGIVSKAFVDQQVDRLDALNKLTDLLQRRRIIDELGGRLAAFVGCPTVYPLPEVRWVTERVR
jgi:hypothetical protein